MVPRWEKAVNSFQVDFDVDIYITGSNAYLLSSELSTLLSGRYVKIKMLPLSFQEFLDFNTFDQSVRVLAPLRDIPDNYEKVVRSMDRSFIKAYEGIKVKNIMDFLLEE